VVLSTSLTGWQPVVVDVDPQTYVPLGGSISLRVPGNPKIPEQTMRFTVETFERLRISAETEKLLTFAMPAGTRTVRRTTTDICRYQREFASGARHASSAERPAG
jgi:hypothetical protein